MIKIYSNYKIIMASSLIMVPCLQAWRIVPILAPRMYMGVSAFDRGINSLLSFNFSDVKGMPLYEKGAPRQIFIIDAIEGNELIFSRVDFIQKGCFSPPQDITNFFKEDQRLQDFIRATTGIHNPHGFVCRHKSEIDRGMVVGISYVSSLSGDCNFFVDTFVMMLQSSACFEYKPSHCIGIRRAAVRPCIFVSALVTDAMLLEEFGKISWQTIADYAAKYQQSARDITRLRKAYDSFQGALHRIRTMPHGPHDVLCIV